MNLRKGRIMRIRDWSRESQGSENVRVEESQVSQRV